MLRRALLIILVFVVSGPLAAGKLVTIEDSLAIRDVGSPAFTPDGKYLIFTVSDWDKKENRRVSHVYSVATTGGPLIQLTRGEKGETGPQASPDGRWLAFLAERDKADDPDGERTRQIWLLPLAGGEPYKLTSEENGITDFSWSPDSQKIAYVTRDSFPNQEERKKKKKDKFDAVVVDQNFLWSHLWTVDLTGKEKKRLTEGEFNVDRVRYSPDGSRIAFVATFVPWQGSGWKHIDGNRNSDIYLVSSSGGKAENLTPQAGRENNPQWSPDGTFLAYTATKDVSEWPAKEDLVVLEPASRKITNLTSKETDSAGAATWSKDGARLLFSMGKGIHTNIYTVAGSGGAVQPLTSDPGIAGGSGASFDLSPDGKLLVYRANEIHKPADVWILSLENKTTRQLTTLNPQVSDFAIAETRTLQWTSSDGKVIEGILTLPLGYREGTKYPLILQIHGGPYGRFSHSFQSRNQIFAAHGYAILQPNPRGSTGYGHDFTVANRGDWGGNDFHADDLSGVDHVIHLGIADPEKLVVMGGSYGGFSTFWAVTQTNRFKAAIGHAGISDWFSFYGQSDIPGLMEYGFLGKPWEQAESYRKYSPITYVTKVKTPLLITHGERDRRVPISQAEQYYTALKKLGLEVEFVRYPREGHGITEPNHVIDLVGRQLDWFKKHLTEPRP